MLCGARILPDLRFGGKDRSTYLKCSMYNIFHQIIPYVRQCIVSTRPTNSYIRGEYFHDFYVDYGCMNVANKSNSSEKLLPMVCKSTRPNPGQALLQNSRSLLD